MPLDTSITAGSGLWLGQSTDNLPKVFHSFQLESPKNCESEHSQTMNQFRRVRMYGGLALALSMALTWQQSAGAKASVQADWQAPLEAPLELIRLYRQPNSDYSAGHRGVDYRVQVGQSIYSPTNAKIRFNQVLVDRPVLSLETGSGDLIEFEPACGDLPVGTQVLAGEPIGRVCPAAGQYQQHCPEIMCLHFSLRTKNGYLSPIVRYGALAPSVLLPYL